MCQPIVIVSNPRLSRHFFVRRKSRKIEKAAGQGWTTLFKAPPVSNRRLNDLQGRPYLLFFFFFFFFSSNNGESVAKAAPGVTRRWASSQGERNPFDFACHLVERSLSTSASTVNTTVFPTAFHRAAGLRNQSIRPGWNSAEGRSRAGERQLSPETLASKSPFL